MDGRLSAWHFAIAALGLNLWAFLFLVPLWHHGSQNVGAGYFAALALPLLVLAIGLYRRRPAALCVGFPLALTVPLVVAAQLKLYHGAGPGSIVLITAAFVIYQMSTPLLLRAGQTPKAVEIRPVNQRQKKARNHATTYWIVLSFTVIAPSALLYAALLSPETRRWAETYYPLRRDPALTLLAIGATGLWLMIFFHSVLDIGQSHIRGDRLAAIEIRRFRGQINARKSHRRLYFWATAAALLALIAALI